MDNCLDKQYCFYNTMALPKSDNDNKNYNIYIYIYTYSIRYKCNRKPAKLESILPVSLSKDESKNISSIFESSDA